MLIPTMSMHTMIASSTTTKLIENITVARASSNPCKTVPRFIDQAIHDPNFTDWTLFNIQGYKITTYALQYSMIHNNRNAIRGLYPFVEDQNLSNLLRLNDAKIKKIQTKIDQLSIISQLTAQQQEQLNNYKKQIIQAEANHSVLRELQDEYQQKKSSN